MSCGRLSRAPEASTARFDAARKGSNALFVQPLSHSPRAYSGACGSPLQIDELPSQARDVRGLFPRRTLHASCASPWHLSAKPCVLETCLLLTGPFRAMLLTSESGP